MYVLSPLVCRSVPFPARGGFLGVGRSQTDQSLSLSLSINIKSKGDSGDVSANGPEPSLSSFSVWAHHSVTSANGESIINGSGCREILDIKRWWSNRVFALRSLETLSEHRTQIESNAVRGAQHIFFQQYPRRTSPEA